MPRIPLSNAQKIGHTSASVNQQSAPGMNFGMDDARALQGAGDTVGQVGRGLGNALMRFGEQVQQAEDRLAAAEYETEWNKRQKELETRMKKNPGSVKEFGKWADDADTTWKNDSKQYTDRMSKRYREVFETNWRRQRDNAVYRRQELTIQAQVKSLQDGYTRQIQDLCQTGDYSGAKRLIGSLTELETSPFTADQIDGFNRFVEKSEVFNELRDAFDGGNIKVIENSLEFLKARNKEGGYLHDPGITEEERAKWIKYGENIMNTRRNDDAKAYLAEVTSTGKYQSKQELDQLLKEEKITPADYNFRWKIADAKEKEDEKRQAKAFADKMAAVIAEYEVSGRIIESEDNLEELRDRGVITDAQFIEGMRALKLLQEDNAETVKAEYNLKAAQEKAKMEQVRAAFSDLEALILISDYPGPDQQLSWRTGFYDEIKKKFADYPQYQKKLMDAVDKRLNDDPLEKTEVGKELKKTVEGYLQEFGANWSGLGGWSDAEVVDLKLQFYHAARQLASNPGANYTTCSAELEKVKKVVLEHKIKKIFNPVTGKLYDFNKYGKVFKESEIKVEEGYYAPYSGPLAHKFPGSKEYRLKSQEQIAGERAVKARELEAQGYINLDKFDRKTVRDDKTGKERTLWKFKEGDREVYADEYGYGY